MGNSITRQNKNLTAQIQTTRPVVFVSGWQKCHRNFNLPRISPMSVRKLVFVSMLALTLACSGAFAQTLYTQSGQTSVALSSTFLGALQSLHVTPGILNPTTINSKGVVTFPITGGA